jgi:Tfp pilus assembly protein PilX
MNNKGSSLILAIFILVVFNIIGVTLVKLFINQNVESLEEFQSVQALYTAESGAEVAIFKCISNASDCNDDTYYINDDRFIANVKFTDNFNFNGKIQYIITSEGVVAGDIKRKVKIKFRN